MKRSDFWCLALGLGFSALFSCSPATDKTTVTDNTEATNEQLAHETGSTLSQEDLRVMGEHLVITSGCDDCHSPKKYNQGMPEPDQGLRLSGHPAKLAVAPYDQASIKNGWSMTNPHFTAWVGPWGVSFASNITPDKGTGIGNWTEENFFRAMREGKYGGTENGRMLLPPMPWPNFSKFTDEELRAIFTYLKSLPPISNPVPAPIPPKGA